MGPYAFRSSVFKHFRKTRKENPIEGRKNYGVFHSQSLGKSGFSESTSTPDLTISALLFFGWNKYADFDTFASINKSKVQEKRGRRLGTQCQIWGIANRSVFYDFPKRAKRKGKSRLKFRFIARSALFTSHICSAHIADWFMFPPIRTSTAKRPKSTLK